MDKYKNEFIDKGEYDVLVVGGGIAGVAAALSATRNGKRVCIFEKSVVLGGLATLGLVNWYEPLCDGNGKQLIGGIAEELLKLSIKDGISTLDENWINGKKPQRRFSTSFSPTLFSIKLNELLINEGVKICYDSLVTYPVVKDNRVLGLIVETVSGSEFFKGKMIIDATGTAIIFDRIGAPCKTGKNYLGYLSYITDFNDNVSERIDVRRWEYAGANMFGTGQPEGYDLLVGDTSDDVNTMIIKGQLMLSEKMKKYSNKEIINLTGMPQFRMIKHLVGEYELTGDDLFKTFDDSIGVVGYFFKPNEWLEIPIRAMYNKDFPNLLPAGRIISAHDKAWDITRVIPVAALTGEVSGVMACMAIDKNIDVKDIDVKELQEKLKKLGIKLHY